MKLMNVGYCPLQCGMLFRGEGSAGVREFLFRYSQSLEAHSIEALSV
jgi:hypothetical protein